MRHCVGSLARVGGREAFNCPDAARFIGLEVIFEWAAWPTITPSGTYFLFRRIQIKSDLRSLLPARLKAKVPPAAGGLLDYVQREKQGLVGLPLNGQARRLELIRDLIDRLQPDSIIETGTFRGSSTLVLAELIDGPVHTIEAFPRFYHFAKRRLKRASNVHVHLGDSADTLQRLAETEGLSLSKAFIYLDAHSSELPGVMNVADELPLNRELKIIADKWSESVILVDDFEVSDDPGYGFDQYVSGNLDLSYLDRVGLAGRFGLFYPAARSSDESGARRGSLILTTCDQAEEIASSSSLLRRLPIG